MLRWGRVIALLLMCLALAGCGEMSGTASYGLPAATQAATSAPSATASGGQPGAGSAAATGDATGLQVFVEPAAGESPVLHAIESAQRSVWVEVYLLTDTNVIHALEDAAARGVQVRVLLELNPYGAGTVSPQETLQELQAAGVQAEGADSAYHYTHEKAIIVDGATLLILTANLTKSALGGSSYADNREYGIVDANAVDVQEAASIFQADWQRTTPTLSDPNLVVSPVNARARLQAFIAGAHTTLILEDEEMVDQQSEDALIAAAGRGASVEVVLPKPSGSSGADADVTRLLQGGVRVRYISNVYMHAKMMVADGHLAFVGSENFSATSLDENRELGILIADPTVIATLTQTFQQDWSSAQAA
ncbi:MAG TPA: phospholipase D-like domain-containing protein [Ktedonobacterales bacterium]|nr:phospholipase D-like domain-containing protein [Ktedonobacterales bacterium]